jgi:hypothetical protein
MGAGADEVACGQKRTADGPPLTPAKRLRNIDFDEQTERNEMIIDVDKLTGGSESEPNADTLNAIEEPVPGDMSTTNTEKLTRESSPNTNVNTVTEAHGNMSQSNTLNSSAVPAGPLMIVNPLMAL